jgi:AcrR family transcriptional regulator
MAPKVSAEYMRARREEILDAATKVFSVRGFHAATLDNVAEAAEVSKGSLYLHFDSKESMIDGLAENWEAIDAETFDAADRERRPVDGLALVAKTSIRRMQSDGFDDSVRLGVFLWAEVLINTAVEKTQMNLVDEWRERVHNLAVLAQKAGEIGPQHDAWAVTSFLGALTLGLLVAESWGFRSDRAALEMQVDSYLRSLEP